MQHYTAIPLHLSESVQLLKRLHLHTVTNCLHIVLLHSGMGQGKNVCSENIPVFEILNFQLFSLLLHLQQDFCIFCITYTICLMLFYHKI